MPVSWFNSTSGAAVQFSLVSLQDGQSSSWQRANGKSLRAKTYWSCRSGCVGQCERCFQETLGPLTKEESRLNATGHLNIIANQTHCLREYPSVNAFQWRNAPCKKLHLMVCTDVPISTAFISDHVWLSVLFYSNCDEEAILFLLQWMFTWFTADIERVCSVSVCVGGRVLVHLRVWMLELTREVHCMWAYFSIHAYVSKCFHDTRWGHAWGSTCLQTVACMQIKDGDVVFFLQIK